MMTSYPREKARHHHHNSTTKKQQKEKGKQLYRKDKICPPPSNIFTVPSMLFFMIYMSIKQSVSYFSATKIAKKV